MNYQRISDFSRCNGIVAIPVCNSHSHVGRLHNDLLRHISTDISVDTQVNLIRHSLVC